MTCKLWLRHKGKERPVSECVCAHLLNQLIAILPAKPHEQASTMDYKSSLVQHWAKYLHTISICWIGINRHWNALEQKGLSQTHTKSKTHSNKQQCHNNQKSCRKKLWGKHDRIIYSKQRNKLKEQTFSFKKGSRDAFINTPSVPSRKHFTGLLPPLFTKAGIQSVH